MPKKRNRPASSPSAGGVGVRFAVVISQESSDQIADLARVFCIKPGAVVTQAVARWHHQEPLLNSGANGAPAKKKRTRKNGPDQSRV